MLSLHCQGLELVNQISSKYQHVVELTEINYAVAYWQRIARICWIIAKRASYLTETIRDKINSGTSIYGSATQVQAFLASPRGAMFVDCLAYHKELMDDELGNLAETLRFIRVQTDEPGDDPIVSYTPSSDAKGILFRHEVEEQLKSADSLVGAAVHQLSGDKTQRVKEQVAYIKKLFEMIEAISQGKTITV